MFERFTGQARGVVVRAQHEAQQLRHPYIGTEHLLLALLSTQAGVAYSVLHNAGVDAQWVRADVERLVGRPRKILSEDDAVALQRIGIDLDAVLASIEESFGPHALTAPCSPPRRRLLRRRRGDRTRFAPRTKKVLERSLREAVGLNHNYIGAEHILLGLLGEGEGLAAKILTDAGHLPAELRRATLSALDKAA